MESLGFPAKIRIDDHPIRTRAGKLSWMPMTWLCRFPRGLVHVERICGILGQAALTAAF